ncbi:hypothetical protein LA345_13155 [Burkholderia vietnamiensis]|uniref:Uncharacterized protein n=1 Tax=Burkholderia vietnamiensis (strain G4 / LMG 22486) TaxID=269482 RepID=A4JFP6_BURVG|nr:hypothetical protein Bcep1808_2097 [Burkholderia vietnamiensis G4]MCB4344861.1 hypothetical protein [Burkholderia vietnamiensis]
MQNNIFGRTDVTIDEHGIPRTPDGTALRREDKRPVVVSVQVAPCFETSDHHVQSQFADGPDHRTQFWGIYLRFRTSTTTGDEFFARNIRDISRPDLNHAREVAESLAQHVADTLNANREALLRTARERDPSYPDLPRIFVEAHKWERSGHEALEPRHPPIEQIPSRLAPSEALRRARRDRSGVEEQIAHVRVL